MLWAKSGGGESDIDEGRVRADEGRVRDEERRDDEEERGGAKPEEDRKREKSYGATGMVMPSFETRSPQSRLSTVLFQPVGGCAVGQPAERPASHPAAVGQVLRQGTVGTHARPETLPVPEPGRGSNSSRRHSANTNTCIQDAKGSSGLGSWQLAREWEGSEERGREEGGEGVSFTPGERESTNGLPESRSRREIQLPLRSPPSSLLPPIPHSPR